MSKGHQRDFSLSRFKAIGFAMLAIFTVLFAVPQTAQANPKYASIVMDADTGIILHSRHADKRLHPASLTKVMTLIMAFDAMESGNLSLNTRLRMSRHAASMVPSKIGLKPGQTIRTKDAIYLLVTKSANDVAVAMAEHIGGTESNFAKMMTRKARAIGMRSTTFRNASGLHHPRQVSTARDMALMAQYVINAYPEHYRFFSRKHYTYQGTTYRNHNKLMSSYQGMDGMKTGYIAAAGFNLVASAVRNNRRIIGVVFGGRSGKTRNAHMASLLDKGFGRVNTIRVAEAKVPLPARKPGVIMAMAALRDNGGPAAGFATGDIAQAANDRLASMGHLIGEGDFDDDKIRRIETGMIAMAAHTGRDRFLEKRPIAPWASSAKAIQASLKPAPQRVDGWAIQLGAFTSRARTDQMLMASLQALPQKFDDASPVIAPLKTRDGWLFRGRLAGFTQAEAAKACAYFRDCMAIAPHNY